MSQIQTIDRREVNETGIVLSNMGEVQQFALELVRSAMCPKAYVGKPHDAVIAIVAGRAVGLSPLQALSGIAVIGGRPSMFGEARAAVVLASGKAEWVKEWFELDGKACEPQGVYDLKTFPARLTACWQAKRTDQTEPTEVVRFAVGDAKLAGLWGKAGPWSQYPLRMLRMRARAFGERDYFSDATHGIAQAEEMEDIKRHGKDKIEMDLAAGDGKDVEQVQGEEVQPEGPEPVTTPETAANGQPGALPGIVTDAERAGFRMGVAKHRAKCESSMDNDGFIAQIIENEFGLTELELETLDRAQYSQVCASLKAGRYDWATASRLPEQA